MARNTTERLLEKRERELTANPGDPLAPATQADIRNLELTIIRATYAQMDNVWKARD
jgi:hypothetical protein